jgi:hypothetical protein
MAKYEAKNVGGIAVSQAAGVPWASITQTNAIAAASGACSSCRLITDAEWLTAAHNVLNVSSNWSSGEVGNGYIYRGHSDNTPANSLAASSDDNDGYAGTGEVSGDQRRTLMLSNGGVIWDLAGNVWEWTSGQISGGQPGGGVGAWREWNAIEGTGTLSPSPFPSFGTPAASGWTNSNGLGMAYSNSSDVSLRGLRRGASWSTGSNAGLFTLALNSSPSNLYNYLGFRIVED